MMIRSGVYDRRAASDAAAFNCLPGEGRTLQSQKDSTDINLILKNFGATGILPQARSAPSYGDFSGVDDYRTALHLLKDADDAFMSLPAKVRVRFNHDPAEYVDFCSDPKNLDEMRELGIAVPAPAPVTGTVAT